MLYRALVGESISQFRRHHFRCRSLSGLCPSFDDGTTCPVCPKSKGNLIVTMDANFGLVRKRSSGSSLVEPLHGNRMFVREEDVQEYLSSHPDGSKPNEKKAEAMQQGVSLAVPAFHVFGHKLQCQVLYSTRRLKGFGLTDGEGMERLWSFLRRFARVTKEMSPSHRLDLLTEALLYYGRRKSADIEVQLHHRWEKAEKVTNLAKEELAAVLKEAPDSVPKWKRVYVTTLIELQQLKSCDHDSAVADEKKIESCLQKIERQYYITRRWNQSDSIFQSTLLELDQDIRGKLVMQARTEARERLTLLQLKRKYPDGQGIAVRLSKQIKACNKRLRKTITDYNSLQWPPQTTIFPPQMDFQEACDPSWPVYCSIDENTEEGDFSRSLKRRAIDALHLKTRAAEEKIMLQDEMKTLIHHVQQQHASLHSAITNTKQPGSRAVLVGTIINLEQKLHNATLMFQQHIPSIAPLSHAYLPQLNVVRQNVISPDVYMALFNDDDDDDDDEDGNDDEEEDCDDSI
ncbi:uncharacterized protein LOC114857791 isoform X2 [Betta splendens]|uniref:Uncharacterized protein LOC114857791 isoform X2 n=1 Tax=Betta splendens TaxID=158456 RepID=A0A8M1HFL2_BETSP|nr:uncharacterized protein LOC114857791 isoform X2 [Betta splendens]